MNGNEAIIDKILSDVKEKANAITLDAQIKAEDIIKDATEWAAEYTATREAELKKETEDIVQKKLTVAALDVRKIVLAEKQEVISKVFFSVYKMLCDLKKPAYLRLVEKLMTENAEAGDKVILAKDGVLDKNDIQGLNVYAVKKLSVSLEKGDFIGGVYLDGKVCDKDLSFKALVNQNRDKYLTKISNELF